MKKLAANKAEEHIDDDHEEAKGEEERRVAEDLRHGRRHADDEEKEVNKIGADFLGSADRGDLFIAERGDEHGYERDPYVFAAEKGVEHMKEPVFRRNKARQGRADVFGQGHDDGGIHDVDGNVAQGNILAAPVRRREGLAFVGAAALFYGVDMGVRKVFPEKGVADAAQQDEKINSHVEVVGDDSRRNEASVGLKHVG